MRMCERTLIQAELAPRVEIKGELGGSAEYFSGDRIAFRASRIPEEGGLRIRERGAAMHAEMRLLVPADVPAKAGDGVWMEGGLYRILSVQRWTAHVELICEAI